MSRVAVTARLNHNRKVKVFEWTIIAGRVAIQAEAGSSA